MYITFNSNLVEVKGLLNNHKNEEAIELLYKINDYLLNDMRIEDSVKVSNLISLVSIIKGHYNVFVETGNIDDFDISSSYYNKVTNIIDELLEDGVVDEVNVDEVNVDEVNVDEVNVDEVIKPKKADKVSFNKSFEVNINGLAKSYSITTEEVETSYGYTDIVYKMEAKSTILIDGEYVLIKAYIELYDGVVTHVHIGRDNNHLQLESFLSSINAKCVSKAVKELVDDIKYEASSYVGEKDINFAYSLLSMVLNINSFDTSTYLINNTTYNLVDVA